MKKRSSKGSACSRYDGASEGSRAHSDVGIDIKPLNLKVNPIIQKIVDDSSDHKKEVSVSQRLTMLGAQSSIKSPLEMMTSSPNFSKNVDTNNSRLGQGGAGLSMYLAMEDMNHNSVSVSSQSNNLHDIRS
mmetsp:Transcript_37508/g.57454  ORF Transcript_37508/g.57454 Transcript_37508/m.57454 type:complete len:131 (+) Transcript_37508:421-813(+)